MYFFVKVPLPLGYSFRPGPFYSSLALMSMVLPCLFSGLFGDLGLSLPSTSSTVGAALVDDINDDDHDDDSHSESNLAAEETHVEEIDSLSAKSFSPSPALLLRWQKALDFPKAMPVASRQLGPQPKKVVKRWADPDIAPDFAAPRREDCLHASFEAVSRKHPELWKLALHAAGASGAAAHAAISASATVEVLFAEFQKSLGEDPVWGPWISSLQAKASSAIAKPLQDAVTCCASIYGLATTQVRNAVIKEADKSIQSILKSKPPSNGFFFGDPSEAIHSRMQYEFMASALKPKANSSGSSKTHSSFAPRPRTVPAKKPASANTSKAGNNSGRASRGGKFGRKF